MYDKDYVFHLRKDGNTSIPSRATDGSAGFDLRVDLLSENMYYYYLEPGEYRKFSSDKSYRLEHNERVCQLLFMPVIIPKLNLLRNVKLKGEGNTRGDKGFGSTGKL